MDVQHGLAKLYLIFFKWSWFFLFLGIVCSLPVNALSLRPDSPARYVVEPGDTLWGIANRYLEKPWEWEALWHANPQIKNPHHLYPGAVIALRFQGKTPYLKVLSNGTVKLSPDLRPAPAETPIPAIPLSDIKPFLNGSLVLDKNSLRRAPFIIAFTTEHLLGGQGDEVYVKDLCPNYALPPGVTVSYGIYRPCGVYRDPISGCLLGHKAILVGYAELVRGGDPATILLTDITQGVELRDRVMPNNHPDFDLSFEPRAPQVKVRGLIIDLPGDYTQGAVGLVAVLNKGRDAGLRSGDVLGIYTKSHSVRNPKCPPDCVRLPPERIGEVMVFRTFTHTSFALVMRSIRAVTMFDKVRNP